MILTCAGIPAAAAGSRINIQDEAAPTSLFPHVVLNM